MDPHSSEESYLYDLCLSFFDRQLHSARSRTARTERQVVQLTNTI